MGLNMLINKFKSAGEIKCVIVGDGGVGKTSLLLSYTTGGIMMDYIPTCFDAYTVDLTLADKMYAVSLVDTAGQETYDRLRTLSYYDTDIFIVCFSVTDPDSFDNVKTKWIPEIKQYRPNTPFILVGTQTDLRYSGVEAPGEHITTQQGKRVARKYGAKTYSECSALKGQGLDFIFRQALEVAILPKKRRHIGKRLGAIFRKNSCTSAKYS